MHWDLAAERRGARFTCIRGSGERKVARDGRNMENPKKESAIYPEREGRKEEEEKRISQMGKQIWECSDQAGPTDGWDCEV